MARLFLSLYVFIAIALVGLSAILEHVFYGDENPTSLQNVLSTESYALAKVLRNALEAGLDLQSITNESNIRTHLLPPNSIAWLPEQKQLLAEQQPVYLFDPKQGKQLYIQLKDGRLLELSIPTSKGSETPLYLYSSVFFILLAVLIAAWIWPLWRDLSTIERSIQALQPDGNTPDIQLTKGSVVGHIASAINHMNHQLSSLLKTQKELSGAMAHEFRTPLSRLKFALAMKPEPDTSPWDEMNADVKELEQLIQEMLDYASMEAQIPDMNVSELPLQELCKKVIQRIKANLPEHIQLQLSGSNSLIMADGHFVERALENLLLNASRYAQHKILVSVVKMGSSIEVRVEDDGPGVPAKMRDKIFEPFFRPDNSRDRKQGGAGLGLAIVKRVQQWHQGECVVRDSALGGAVFVLIYPASELVY